MKWKVTLTQDQLRMIAMEGCNRSINAIFRHARDVNGEKPPDRLWDSHIVGAVGEFAVAYARGIPWSAMGIFGGDDVRGYQVRTAHRPTDRLFVYPTDPDAERFVFVTGPMPTLWIRGWLFGYEAKQPTYWHAPDGKRFAFYVPVADLHPMDTLDTVAPYQETEVF